MLCIKYIQKEEVKEHDKNAKALVFSGQNPIYNAPETSHTLDHQGNGAQRKPLMSNSWICKLKIHVKIKLNQNEVVEVESSKF